MKHVYLGIGSNLEREKHVKSAVMELKLLFGKIEASKVYESKAVGFDGANFLNMVVGFCTTMPLDRLFAALREIEYRYGRKADEKVIGDRYLDIDILTYGDMIGKYYNIELPRSDITENAFVLAPLAEIAPDVKHPLLALSYQEMWRKFDKLKQLCWSVDFVWS